MDDQFPANGALSARFDWLHENALNLEKRLGALEAAAVAQPAQPVVAEAKPLTERPEVAMAHNIPDFIPDNAASRNTYHKKVQILRGRVPDLDALKKFSDRLLPGRYYSKKTACVPWVCSPEEAGAILFLAKHAGFVQFVTEKMSYEKIEVKDTAVGSSESKQ